MSAIARPIIIILLIILFVVLCIALFLFLRPIFFPSSPSSQPPVANLNGPYVVDEGQPLLLDGSSSTGSISNYSWFFGDGNTGSGIQPTHTYGDGPNQYTLTLIVTDDQGETSTTTTQVTVNNMPPTANTGGPYRCTIGEVISLNGVCDDPGSADAGSVTCIWSDINGAVEDNLNYHCPDTAGEMTVTLTATDKDGGSVQSDAVVTVILDDGQTGEPSVSDSDPDADADSGADTPTVDVSQAPVNPIAVISVTLRSKNGSIFGFSAADSSDPDGTIVSYDWVFGDGTMDWGIVVFHTYTLTGTFPVTLTITDNDGLIGVDSTTVNVP